MNGLPISEIFGPTIQGEGPYAGRRARFIRFGGCNLSCVWCDTPYTWDGTRFDLRTEITTMSVEAIVNALAPDGGIVVLTGGEPLLYAHRPEFTELLRRLVGAGCAIHVESNATLVPPRSVIDLVSVFVLSPKLFHAGNPVADAVPPGEWLDVAAHAEVHLKIVCFDRHDVQTAAMLAQSMHWPTSRIWVMPLGATTHELETRWPAILDAATEFGINATHRLHILAWGDVRGR